MLPRGVAGTVGLFPPIGPDVVGGVQASGRLAWEAVAGAAQAAGVNGGPGPRLLTWGGPRSGGVPWGRVRAVLDALRCRRDASVVLVWHLSLLRLLLLLRPRAAHVVVFLHGIEAWRRQDRLTRRLLGGVDLFLSNSDHTWRRFVAGTREAGGCRHRTVPLGIGSPLGGPTPDPDPTPATVVVSRLLRAEGYKGHRELLRAWPMVLERHPTAELWIVGDGDLRPDLVTEARRLGLDDRVRFQGQLSEPQKERLIARARCLALPSRGEGFGLVYAEAMRLGRPCLVSSLDAGPEVVNPPEAGLAADPGKPRELAEALTRLVSSGPEWDRWSAQARRRYERCFTARHFQERLLAALPLRTTPAEAQWV